MLGGRNPDDAGGGAPPRLSLWHRLLLSLPHLRHDSDKAPLGERLRNAFLKPVEPDAAAKAKVSGKTRSVEELEGAARFANDKERLTGLLLAPVSAAIGIAVINDLIAHDPAVGTKQHVNVGVYHELALVLLGLSLLMLVTAFFRKRMYLGIVMALYGLAIFNLKYWGFGVPFVLIAAWLLVRAYRLQRELREATGDTASRRGTQGRGRGAKPGTSGPPSNKRYTPPTPPKRSPPKPENEQKAG
jgi:hypothetical protein